MYVGPDTTKRSSVKGRSGEMVFGAVQRGGRAKVKRAPAAGKALVPEVEKSVDKDAQLYSDSYNAYKPLWLDGWSHKMIAHHKKIYVDGKVHTQNVENLWSNMKRGIKGVYRHVDPKYLQAYADEYAFRYSHRHDFQPMFWSIMNRVVKN